EPVLHARGDRGGGPVRGPGPGGRRAAAGRGAGPGPLGQGSPQVPGLHASASSGVSAVNEFTRAIHWLFTASNWDTVNFQTGIRAQLAYHVEISVLSVFVAAAIAVPAGMLVGHKRRGQFLTASVANVGRAIPSFGLVVLAFIAFGNVFPS